MIPINLQGLVATLEVIELINLLEMSISSLKQSQIEDSEWDYQPKIDRLESTLEKANNHYKNL